MTSVLNPVCRLWLITFCILLSFICSTMGYGGDSYAGGSDANGLGDDEDEGALTRDGWLDVGKLDWGPISPVPYWPLPFLPPAWPLFPNRDFAYGYYPFPYTWGFPGYSRGFYGGHGGGYGKR